MVTAADARTVSLATPAKPEYVVLARLALSAVCRLTALPPDEVADLKLAITEAAALLMGTGAIPEEPGRVSFAFELADSRLALAIERVEGSGPPEGVAPEDEELAVAILNATADECSRTDTSVRLVKYLDPAAE